MNTYDDELTIQHDQLLRQVGQRDQLKTSLDRTEKQLNDIIIRAKVLTEALEIIQTVAQLTQKELEIHISELVSLALEAVFPNPYKLVLQFQLRRNRSEADLLLEDEEGNQVSPMDAVGGGVVDVAAFALRVALWSLKRPRLNNVMILDEPFRFLSKDLQPKASQLLKELSNQLGLQFIIVTHEEGIAETADKTFDVVIRNGISLVKETPL